MGFFYSSIYCSGSYCAVFYKKEKVNKLWLNECTLPIADGKSHITAGDFKVGLLKPLIISHTATVT